MSLENKKIISTIGYMFFMVFILSAFLVLTNMLNMWLVGIISLFISIACYTEIKIMENKADN